MKKKILTIILILFLILTIFLPNIILGGTIASNKDDNNKEILSQALSLTKIIDKLEKGDIIIHLPGGEKQNGHCRILTDIKTPFIKYTFAETYCHVLSYSCSKFMLKIILLFITYSWNYDGVIIIRVKATDEQKQNAVDFAKLQIGKKFDGFFSRGKKNYNPEDKNDHNANQWYCSELPWAAYYNCNNYFPDKVPIGGYVYGEGIDIDSNGWEIDCRGFLGNEYALVYPKDIINDNDIEIIDTWIRPDREHKYS